MPPVSHADTGDDDAKVGVNSEEIPRENMPVAAKNNLDELYARQRLLQAEATRLEIEFDGLDPEGAGADRRYILDVQIRALQEEETKLNASISDILERDLQR
jgi:hypothetical protein